jgi:serine/threonine protein kinase
MGTVYEAYDPELDRRVSIKLLRPGHPDAGRAAKRLLREARAMAKLAHPNVVPVYDVGSIGDQCFVAMELAAGGTLTGWLQEAPRPWHEVLRVFQEAGKGLAAAHRAGWVHRDFKADNVLIGGHGEVRVTDFGLAREVSGAVSGSAPPKEAGHPRASTSALAGTPCYMAPEQFDGGPTDHRTDQFSFCVALFEALYGRRPFAGETFAELSSAVHNGEVIAPAGDDVPGWLHRVVTRGLSPSPEGRYASMEQMLDALGGPPSKPSRVRPALAVLTIACALLLTGSVEWWRRRQPQVDAPASPPLAVNAVEPGGAVLTESDRRAARETLDGLAAAYQAKDADRALSFFDDDPNTTVIGTGPGERNVGLPAIRSFFEGDFASADTIEFTRSFIRIDGNARVVWTTSDGTLAIRSGGHKNAFPVVVETVLIKRHGQWKITYSRLSVPVRDQGPREQGPR